MRSTRCHVMPSPFFSSFRSPLIVSVPFSNSMAISSCFMPGTSARTRIVSCVSATSTGGTHVPVARSSSADMRANGSKMQLSCVCRFLKSGLATVQRGMVVITESSMLNVEHNVWQRYERVNSTSEVRRPCHRCRSAGMAGALHRGAAIMRPGNGGSVIGALIVTHGQLAYELLNAARKIESNIGVVEAVPLEWTDSVDEAREKIRQALERLGDVHGVIIFTDMFGGTPSNISLSFLEKDRVEIVTGVNLPMIVKFATMAQDSQDLATLAHVISEKGSKAIRVASDLLAANGERRAGAGG